MPRRLPYTEQSREHLLRAVRTARLPGVLRKDVCARFDLSPSMLRRALKEHGDAWRPTRADLVLHALTHAGLEREGTLPDLALVASYLDYVNKDGSTPEDIQGFLDALVDEGRLAIDGERWRLVGEFP